MKKSKEDANFEILKDFSHGLGAASFGVASMQQMKRGGDAIPVKELEHFPYAISLGHRLSDSLMETLKDGPTKLYAYHYRMVNLELDRMAMQLVRKIQQMGYSACPIPSSQIIDWKKQQGHMAHKWVGYNAGIGWYGRNNLLIHPEYGARMRYVSILTDLPLAAGKPIKADCGDCYECIRVCPAEAISEKRENFLMDKCREKLYYFKTKWNIGHYICGLCIKACPGARKGERQIG